MNTKSMQTKITVQATDQGCLVPKIGSSVVDDEFRKVEVEEVLYAYATNFGSVITFVCQVNVKENENV